MRPATPFTASFVFFVVAAVVLAAAPAQAQPDGMLTIPQPDNTATTLTIDGDAGFRGTIEAWAPGRGAGEDRTDFGLKLSLTGGPYDGWRGYIWFDGRNSRYHLWLTSSTTSGPVPSIAQFHEEHFSLGERLHVGEYELVLHERTHDLDTGAWGEFSETGRATLRAMRAPSQTMATRMLKPEMVVNSRDTGVSYMVPDQILRFSAGRYRFVEQFDGGTDLTLGVSANVRGESRFSVAVEVDAPTRTIVIRITQTVPGRDGMGNVRQQNEELTIGQVPEGEYRVRVERRLQTGDDDGEWEAIGSQSLLFMAR